MKRSLLSFLAALALAVWMLFRVQRALEEKHRQMLGDLHDGLVKQGDRLGAHLGELRERMIPERAATRGEDDAPHLVTRAAL